MINNYSLHLPRIGWSFVVEFRFDDFINFCHDCCITLEKDNKTYPILITHIEIYSLDFDDINRGKYIIEFDILQPKSPDLQLSLF